MIDRIHEIDSAITAVFVPVELDSLDSVRRAASQINGLVDKVDYLINNAGVMAVKPYTLSKDGVESQLAINHLSHFLLTSLLWPKIVRAGEEAGARVIMVASDGYTIGPFRFENWNFSVSYFVHTCFFLEMYCLIAERLLTHFLVPREERHMTRGPATVNQKPPSFCLPDVLPRLQLLAMFRRLQYIQEVSPLLHISQNALSKSLLTQNSPTQ